MTDQGRFHRWLLAQRHTALSEVKTFARLDTPERQRKQQILTPAQQLEMRTRVSKAKDIKSALAIIDGYIFSDESDGEADSIQATATMRDPYSLDYAVTNWYSGG